MKTQAHRHAAVPRMSWCHMVMEELGTIHPSVSFYFERSPPHHVLSFSLFIYFQSDLLGP